MPDIFNQNGKFDFMVPAGGNIRLSVEQDKEMITNLVDRDFSGAGNWTGTGWTVSGGKFQHTTTSDITIAELRAAYITPGIYRYQRYKVTFTISSYAAGTLTPAIGNQRGNAVRANGTYTQIIQSPCYGCSLIFIPSGFNGYLDDVSVKAVIDAVGVDSTGSLVSAGYYPGNDQKCGTLAGYMGKVSTGIYPLMPSHGTLVIDGLDSDTIKCFECANGGYWIPNSKFSGGTNATLTRGLLCCYNLEENAANTTVADATGRAAGTSSVNTSTLHATGSGVTNLGDYFDFRGGANNDYVTLTGVESTAGEYLDYGKAFSVSMWINPDSVAAYRVLFGTATFSNQTGFNFCNRIGSTNGRMGYLFVSGANFHYSEATTTALAAGSWYHVVFVYNGGNSVLYNSGNIKIYVNGTLQTLALVLNSGTISASCRDSKALRLAMTADTGADAYDYDGKMDQVLVWNRPITPEEVALLYNSGNGLAF